jgi:hypothetical protein
MLELEPPAPAPEPKKKRSKRSNKIKTGREGAAAAEVEAKGRADGPVAGEGGQSAGDRVDAEGQQHGSEHPAGGHQVAAGVTSEAVSPAAVGEGMVRDGKGNIPIVAIPEEDPDEVSPSCGGMSVIYAADGLLL